MLVMVDTPTYLNTIYDKAKELGEEIFRGVGEVGERKKMEPGEDLLAGDKALYYFVHSGTFHFRDMKGRIVRYYSENDFIAGGPTEHISGSKITSDEGGEATVFDRETFIQALSKNPALLRTWMDLQELEGRILHILGSVFLEQGLSEDIAVASYEPGDVILEQDSDADEICLLVEGRAKVLSKGVRVGTVEAGEVFGEIAFLTGQKRSATVVAEHRCVVHIADNKSFVKLARARPQIVVEMSRALARRIVALNEKVRTSTQA